MSSFVSFPLSQLTEFGELLRALDIDLSAETASATGGLVRLLGSSFRLFLDVVVVLFWILIAFRKILTDSLTEFVHLL